MGSVERLHPIDPAAVPFARQAFGLPVTLTDGRRVGYAGGAITRDDGAYLTVHWDSDEIVKLAREARLEIDARGLRLVGADAPTPSLGELVVRNRTVVLS